MPRALVVGGGIGGLSAAVALLEAGWEVAVFERSPSLREVGAGLTVQPNAMKALETLGLSAAVASAGHRLEYGFIGTLHGEHLTRFDFSDLAEQLEQPAVAIGRPGLLKILREPLPDGLVHCGRACTGYAASGDRVRVQFEDGPDEEGDVLIGADGIHSVVRRQLLGESPTRYAGYTCWRGVVDIEGLWDPRLSGEHWGRGTRFGLTCIGGGKLYWFAVADAPEGEVHPEPKEACTERFADWCESIRRVIEATPAEAVLHNDIIDRPPVKRWGEGRVTLLGDAAHATTPNLGQGACLAIEDAVVLAARLRDEPDAAAALRSYEGLRIPRANAIVRQSWQMGKVGHWSNPLAAGLRNWLVRRAPRGVRDARMLDFWRFEGPS